jgi:hypothetical protein
MRLVRWHKRVFRRLNPDVKQRCCIISFLGQALMLLDSVRFGGKRPLEALLFLNFALVFVERGLEPVKTLADVRIGADRRLFAQKLLVVSQDGRRIQFIQICLVIGHH